MRGRRRKYSEDVTWCCFRPVRNMSASIETRPPAQTRDSPPVILEADGSEVGAYFLSTLVQPSCCS